MKRIQRKRTKGWKMPGNAKYVGRPTKWGNPFRLTPDGVIQCYSAARNEWVKWSHCGGFGIDDIVQLYGFWLDGKLKSMAPQLPPPPSLEELKGKDLACFCPLVNKKGEYTLCHADILLSLANNISLADVINENIRQEKLLRNE